MKPIKYDASKLLYARLENDRFLHKLNISEKDEKLLNEARTKARIAIRQAFKKDKNISKLQEDHQIAINQYLSENLGLNIQTEFKEITPAFWPQGSSVYNTRNYPAHTPPQQIDLDDGVYLPMDIFSDKPVHTKELFFKIIDNALEKLSKKEGWTFDRTKETCSRILVNDYMHLDFPLYAMPRKRFKELKKNSQIALNAENDFYEFNEAVGDKAIELDPNDIYLAMRSKKHWSKSDPKQIENWFNAKKAWHNKIHGEHRLTRVCRYFKAWRDYTWKDGGGPSSIVLMVNVVKVFDQHKAFSRDCEAILAVAKELPTLFKGKIFNPALNVDDDHEDAEEMFQKRHKKHEIEKIILNSEIFFDFMKIALIKSDTKKDVIKWFTFSFGERMPQDTSYVTKLTGQALSGKPIRQNKPVVPNIKHS